MRVPDRTDNWVMTGCLPCAIVVAVPPGSPEGRAALTACFHDIVSRYHGREATRAGARAAVNGEPSEDLAPPQGCSSSPAGTEPSLAARDFACCRTGSARSPAFS